MTAEQHMQTFQAFLQRPLWLQLTCDWRDHMVVAQWLKVLLLFYLAGVGSNHCGSICDFE